MVGEVIDRAMQVHGAEGICREFFIRTPNFEHLSTFASSSTEDTPLASLWAGVRTLRYADGPDVCAFHFYT